MTKIRKGAAAREDQKVLCNAQYKTDIHNGYIHWSTMQTHTYRDLTHSTEAACMSCITHVVYMSVMYRKDKVTFYM